MRAIFALVLLVGVALAGFAVYMAQTYVGQSEARLERATEFQQRIGKLVEVYALKKGLSPGESLSEDNVQLVWVQEKLRPPGTFSEKSVLFPENNPKPRQAVRSIEANEILLASRLTAPGQVASVTGKLPAGMRAFQIRVNNASGISGFVAPDDLIDIYWTGSGAPEISGEITRIIESTVTVIAVDKAQDQSQHDENSTANTLTIAVTPEQVARLTQAQSTGRLTMSLINPTDTKQTDFIQIDRNSLLGVTPAEAPSPEAPAPIDQVCTVKTRKGSDMVEIKIPCTN